MGVLAVPLADIVPNRYRNMQQYQISQDKVEALLQSYASTGFWDGSIQGRPHPTKDGKVEIAFGHHRIAAAKRAGLESVGIVVADRSNADMLKMMADENREEFKHDALVAVETVGTVIEAFGRGEIELAVADEQKSEKFNLPGGKYYSLATVARFLGWVKSSGQATNACRRAFEAYHERAGAAVARELPTEKRSEVAVQSVVVAARVARKEAEKAGHSPAEQERLATKAAKTQAAAVVKDTGFQARREARHVGHAAVHGKPPMPDLRQAVRTLVKQVRGLNDDAIAIYHRMSEALVFARDLPSEDAETAAAALTYAAEELRARADAYEEMAKRWVRKANIKDVTPNRRRHLLQEVV